MQNLSAKKQAKLVALDRQRSSHKKVAKYRAVENRKMDGNEKLKQEVHTNIENYEVSQRIWLMSLLAKNKHCDYHL